MNKSFFTELNCQVCIIVFIVCFKRNNFCFCYIECNFIRIKPKRKFSKVFIQSFVNSTYAVLVLRKKCPYSDLFWSTFSHIRSEQSECGKMRSRITPNTNTFYAVWMFRRSISSAESNEEENLIELCKSFMYNRKSRRSKTDPCGTPKLTLNGSDEIPSVKVNSYSSCSIMPKLF